MRENTNKSKSGRVMVQQMFQQIGTFERIYTIYIYIYLYIYIYIYIYIYMIFFYKARYKELCVTIFSRQRSITVKLTTIKRFRILNDVTAQGTEKYALLP